MSYRSATIRTPAALAPLAWASSLTSCSRRRTSCSPSTTKTLSSSKRPCGFMPPVRRSSASRSTRPEPQRPSGSPPPMTRWVTRPSSMICTRSIAPSSPGMPHRTPPPSNAGPAGHEATRSRFRFPSKTSVFVPMSTHIEISSRSARWVASRQAAASAPTWQPRSGRPYSRAAGCAGNRRRLASISRLVVSRSPASSSCSVIERYGS